MNKEKKIILITGGTSGLGLGLIEYLRDKEEYLIISMSRDEQRIMEAKEKFADVIFLKGDVKSIKECEKIYNFINNEYGKLDYLINNAGILKLGGLEDQSIDEWNNIIDTNLTGMFYVSKTMLPLLKKGKNPAIINITSLSSNKPGGSIGYCASKAGVDIITKFMAQELAKYNIRVNAVCPGATYTNIYVASKDYTKEEYDKWSLEKKKYYPLGKIGDSKNDIAPTIEFLLSESSLWTTGSIFIVDGGKNIAK